MKNVRIKKDIKGYFLTIGDDILNVKHTLAVTALELLTLRKILNDMENELEAEVRDI